MEYVIIFLPLISSIIAGFLGKKIPGNYSQIISSSLVGISGILSLFLFY